MNILDCPLYRTRTVAELLLMVGVDSTEMEKALAEVIYKMQETRAKELATAFTNGYTDEQGVEMNTVERTIHPHAKLIQQWAEDHMTIPPMHEWECCAKSELSRRWARLTYAPSWSRDTEYRRIIKPTPNPNAERIMHWAEDNQTIPPKHAWEYRHDGSEAWHRLACGQSPSWGSNIIFRRIQK